MKRSATAPILAATAWLWLLPSHSAAQTSMDRLVVLHCKKSTPYSPGKGFRDRVSTPVTGDPNVATVSGDMGTAATIDINGHNPGITHITYTVEDFAGRQTNINVTVVVFCRDIPHQPPPFLPKQPPTPTHVEARCPACAEKADEVNAAGDKLVAAAQKLLDDEEALLDAYDDYSKASGRDAVQAAMDAIKDRQATVDNDEAEIKKLQDKIHDLAKELDDCENKFCGGAVPNPPRPPEKPPSTVPKPPKPLKNTGELRSIEPAPGSGSSSGGAMYVPPIAGPGATIFATVVDPNETGPHDVIVGTVDDTGRKSYFKTVTDTAGHLALVVPATITALELFRQFDPQGNPVTPARTEIGTAPHLTGTTPVKTVPANGPAIVEGSPTIERGPNAPSTLALHTRYADPLSAQVLIDGKPVETYAASDSSLVAHIPADLPLGSHEIRVFSGGMTSNAVHAVAAAIQAEPVPLMHIGTVKTLRVHVEGVPPGQPAVVHFEVSGAAVLRGGAPSADVPVRNGLATVAIQAVRTGQLVAHCQLRVTMPEE